uniref:BatA domain-containing protein n=1 Tax=Angiostrongylus cantonensis TaxID=6313 RepID=A0A0K0D0Z3_ANGCA
MEWIPSVPNHQDPVYFDLDPHYVMIASAPSIAQLKINLTLTISIAMERTLFWVMGIAVIILTTFILGKLRAIRQKPQPIGAIKPRERKFKQIVRDFFLYGRSILTSALLLALNEKVRVKAKTYIAGRRPSRVKVELMFASKLYDTQLAGRNLRIGENAGKATADHISASALVRN